MYKRYITIGRMRTNKVITFIVNPAAGHGRSLAAIPIIRRLMDESGRPYTMLETATPGHAGELAQQAAAHGAEIVVSVGGDGTVQELASGLVNTGAALAVIPCGSGNDFVHSLHPRMKKVSGFEARITQYVTLLLNNAPTAIDAVRMNDQYFFNIGSIGIDAEIVVYATRLKRDFRGAAYLLSTLRNIFTYKPKKAKLIVDGQEIEKRLSLCAVSNGSFYGGGFKISPSADMSDGKITLCVIDALNRVMFCLLFPFVVFRAHTKLKQVSYINCTHVAMEYTGVLPVNLDGNIYKLKAPLNFEIIPGGLKVIK